MNRHEKHLHNLALIAEAGELAGNQRLAACLVYKNQMIALGVNKKKTHPFQKQFGRNDQSIFLHAEIDCILNALRRFDVDFLSKCILYVQRVKKRGPNTRESISGLAKPCEGCQRAIIQFGIKKVVYSLDSEGWETL